MSSADRPVWDKGGGKIYIVVIVVAIVINGQLSTLSTMDCVVESSWVVGAGVGIDNGWVSSLFGYQLLEGSMVVDAVIEARSIAMVFCLRNQIEVWLHRNPHCLRGGCRGGLEERCGAVPIERP